MVVWSPVASVWRPCQGSVRVSVIEGSWIASSTSPVVSTPTTTVTTTTTKWWRYDDVAGRTLVGGLDVVATAGSLVLLTPSTNVVDTYCCPLWPSCCLTVQSIRLDYSCIYNPWYKCSRNCEGFSGMCRPTCVCLDCLYHLFSVLVNSPLVLINTKTLRSFITVKAHCSRHI